MHTEARVVAAEAAVVARDYRRALEELDGIRPSPSEGASTVLRAATARAAALVELGNADEAAQVLEGAQCFAEELGVPPLDRAGYLFQVGCARLAAGQIGESASTLTLALDLCNRSVDPSDRLRSQILERRARCHRQHRDWPAARADAERALELAESIGEDDLLAQACLQCSIVAEREGQWIMANFYAERARDLFIAEDDVFGTGRCLNNLGGLAFLLGKPDEARKLLRDSFRILLDLGRDAEAAYAVSSLAQVQLRTGEFEDAERLARRALVFIGSRVDHRTELGNAQLVLGRALFGLGRLDEATAILAEAEVTLERAAVGERAAVWLAQAEIATASGDSEGAVALYRRAAEALQDFHF